MDISPTRAEQFQYSLPAPPMLPSQATTPSLSSGFLHTLPIRSSPTALNNDTSPSRGSILGSTGSPSRIDNYNRAMEQRGLLRRRAREQEEQELGLTSLYRRDRHFQVQEGEDVLD